MCELINELQPTTNQNHDLLNDSVSSNIQMKFSSFRKENDNLPEKKSKNLPEKKMSLKSLCFLRKDLHANPKLANTLARFWISKMPAGLSLIQKRDLLLPIKRDALISLLVDCWENNPEVFAGTHGISLRPVFMGDITHADKFDLELQPVKRADGSVCIIFLYTSDLD